MKVLKSATLSVAVLTITIVLLPAVGRAQSSNPVTDALKASLQRASSKMASILELTGDWDDHYSQEAAYLRANGMLPPTAHHGKP